jgi:hypothetical protein
MSVSPTHSSQFDLLFAPWDQPDAPGIAFCLVQQLPVHLLEDATGEQASPMDEHGLAEVAGDRSLRGACFDES